MGDADATSDGGDVASTALGMSDGSADGNPLGELDGLAVGAGVSGVGVGGGVSGFCACCKPITSNVISLGSVPSTKLKFRIVIPVDTIFPSI